MLACLRQSYQCTCRCWLQYSSRGLCTTDTKFFENPATAVFERKHKIGQVAVGKYPLLKKKHYLLDKLKHPGDYKSTIKCILTKEITDIGLKGTVVEVPKKLFRNELYPSGAAVYASPENLILYEDLRKLSDDGGIDYETKQLMRRMAKFQLRVFMHPNNEWILEPSHVRIAFRKMGVMLKEENIIMPTEPVMDFGNFTFKLQMFDKIACRLQGTIYPLKPDGQPPSEKNFPKVWGGTASTTAIEYLNRPDLNTADVDNVTDNIDKVEENNKDTDSYELSNDDNESK